MNMGIVNSIDNPDEERCDLFSKINFNKNIDIEHFNFKSISDDRNSPKSVTIQIDCKDKKIKWGTSVNVILIPSRKEYFDNKLNDLLWWEQEDYILFKQEYLEYLFKQANTIKNYISKYIKKKNGIIVSSDSEDSMENFF